MRTPARSVFRLPSWICCLLTTLSVAGILQAGALEDYLGRADTAFAWRESGRRVTNGFAITHLELTSQQWREHAWKHDLQIVRPAKVTHPGHAFLFITGDGQGTRQLEMLQTLAGRAGAMAAVVTRVPNQPLYDGRQEDALIAHTFDQFRRSGDATWPLLFPMVKSAVRAMDAVTQFARREYGESPDRFVLSGASKRGWTTWLAAAADSRVEGMAPMVIDMLNMKAQMAHGNLFFGVRETLLIAGPVAGRAARAHRNDTSPSDLRACLKIRIR